MENSSRQKRPHTSVIIRIIMIVVFTIIGYYIYNRDQASDRTELDEALKYRPLPFSTENDYIVEWSDTVLETRIREQLGKEKGGIYLSDLWDCADLWLNTDLDSSSPEFITDISDLTGLKNLTGLQLNFNRITDISAVATMDNLNKLLLHGNPILDFSPLEALSRLRYVNLSGTHMKGEDLKCLSHLKYLRMLYLDFNEIENLDGLQNLNASFLSLRRNQISDITPLAGSQKMLWYLDLSENQIEDISILENFSRLEDLTLCHNNITDIEAIKKLKRLEFLDLRYNNISELPDFTNMDSLTHLYLGHNNITNEEWKKIKLPQHSIRVFLSGNPITDLETERDYPFLKIIVDE